MENRYETAGPGKRIASFWLDQARSLFEVLDDVTGPLSSSHQKVALVLEAVRIEEYVSVSWSSGRPELPRKAIARALVAKATLNIPTTKDLVERLGLDARLRLICGFSGSVPSASTFSRAFQKFATGGLLDLVHEEAVRSHFGEEVVHHASIDASSVPAREHGPRKDSKAAVKEPRKRGRQSGQKAGDRRRALSALEVQLDQDWRVAAFEIPRKCDHGIKIGPKGHLLHWRGYKGHASVGDCGIPLAFLTSSASIHDSRAAIPLLRMTSQRVAAVLYDLMDKAYTGGCIQKAATDLGHVLIVPPKPKKKGDPKPQMTPDQKRRYDHRTNVERFFSDLKDNHGGNFVFVKGGAKVHAHLMMGVLAIFGLCILRL